MMKPWQRQPLSWEVGHHSSRNENPEKWVPAQVPGAVQLDWARAEKWPEYWKADHHKDYTWMEDVHWTYRARPEFSKPADSDRLFFVCKGVDYQFEVEVAGTVLHRQEGMFTPFEIDLTDRAKAGDEIKITVYPAPKSVPAPSDRTQANRSCKPAVSYGWDFHPRLVPLGIWEETYLEVRPASHLTRAEIDYQLADDFSQATVSLSLDWTKGTSGRVRWTLTDPKGATCFQKEIALNDASRKVIQEVAAPQLWWPHDQGDPALYASVVELIAPSGSVLQTLRRSIGFRKIALVMNEGAWLKPDLFPKSRSNPPITLEVNGRRLFCKGANWVNPHIFPGAIDGETYRPLLRQVRESNLNLLRCWGGAMVGKDSFFDQCDELGIMVWQEFPLACNNYPDDPAYLRVLDQESKAIIHRLKPHPSLVIWCGGNELFNIWSGMTDQSLALRLLNRNCFDLDPARPFLPTSPVMGMGHGHYIFYDATTQQDVYGLFQNAACSAYTEFGCPGPSPVEVLKSFLPEGELFPPRHGTSWETHHAFGVWLDASHLYLNVIEDYCGVSKTLEELVEKGQYLQSEGYKGLFEEARRQKPVASMALCWCFNEPWPCAANNSLVSWPAHPKPALLAVKESCRPVLASARIRKFRWKEGELFDPEIWLLSDSPHPLKAGTIEVIVEASGHATKIMSWDFAPCPPQANQIGPRLQFRLPHWDTDRLTLRLRVVGQPQLDSEYRLVYVRTATASEHQTEAARTMNL